MRWWLQLHSVVRYKFLKDEITLRQTKFRPIWTKFRFVEAKFRFVKTIFRFAETKFRFVEAKLRSNDTKFRNKISSHTAKFRFYSSHCLRNFADIRTVEALKFAAFSSETKVRNLITEIRVISLISANFACIFFCTLLYMRVGYVFDLRFFRWKIQLISMIFSILNK